MPLHYVDPNQHYGRWYRTLEKVGRSPKVQAASRRVLWPIDPWLYRVTGGRYPSILGGISTAPLVSTGARSGLQRVHQLTYFHDGADPILVASFMGSPTHPQWYHNLKKNPECRFGGDDFTASEVLDDDDYERLFGLAEKVYGGYAQYRSTAEAAGRRIPLFRLRASGPASG